jgi:hypothetical protein
MLSFLDNIFKPIGKGLSEADTFMNREMPFNMSWGFPAALTAAYFAPQVLGSMGGAGGSGTSYGNLLGSMGIESGGFTGVPGQEGIFEISASQMTPEYLNLLASQQGVSQGDPTFFQRMTGNTEQGLYDSLGSKPMDLMKMAREANKPDPMLEQLNRVRPQEIQTPRGTMKRGDAVDVASGLLSLLAANQPKTRVPRISLL